jgi:hypothetical protein
MRAATSGARTQSGGLRLGRLLLYGTVLCAIAVVAVVMREGTLSIHILDAATGRPTPVRISLQHSNGARVPAPKQAVAVRWSQLDGAEGYALQPDGAFYVDGGFDVSLRPGVYTLTISKGFEYVRQVINVEIGAGAEVSREYRLQRWIDMPAKGWYSSDDHIHLRRSPGDNAAIARWIAAEDIHVGNILEMGDVRATYFPQYAFGESGRYEESGRILSPGQEEPRTPEIGHTISLGASQFVRFQDDYYSYDRLFDRVRELGGVTGFAHQAISFHGYRGMMLNALRGKTDFLELAQFCEPEGPLAVRHYYLFLDLGLRLTALAGSDFPWCGRGPDFGFPEPQAAQIGNARFYAYVEGAFSYERWFAALKAGRTLVSTGPIVLLRVNDHLPGDVVDVAPGTKLRITAEAYGHDSQVPLSALEIVGHGKVLARAAGDTRAQLSVDLELTATHGIWIAAKAAAGTGQVAHTTPVYVTVGGAGFHNPATTGDNLAIAETYLRELEQAMASPTAASGSPMSRHRPQLERQIAEARARLKRLPR